MIISGSTYNAYSSGFGLAPPTIGNRPSSIEEEPGIQPAQPAGQQEQTAPAGQPAPSGQAVQQQDPSANGENPNGRDPAATEDGQEEKGSRENTQTVNGRELTQEEMRVLNQLKQRDAEVKRHEMAHVAAGGQYITSGAKFSYQRGPDGRNYASGGEVGIDTSPVPGDPQATIQKMRQVKRAALAPANPSAQDLKVAANATTQTSKAMSELMVLQGEEQAKRNDTQAFGNIEKAAGTYEQVNNLPESETSSFEIAV